MPKPSQMSRSPLSPVSLTSTQRHPSRLLGLIPGNASSQHQHSLPSQRKSVLTILNLMLMPALGHRLGRLACKDAHVNPVSPASSLLGSSSTSLLGAAARATRAVGNGTGRDRADEPPPVSPSCPSMPRRPPAGAPAMPAAHEKSPSVSFSSRCMRWVLPLSEARRGEAARRRRREGTRRGRSGDGRTVLDGGLVLLGRLGRLEGFLELVHRRCLSVCLPTVRCRAGLARCCAVRCGFDGRRSR